MDFKLLGCILLIVGTSIGAGMLALPIATAHVGFIGSLVLLFACWFIMTAGALLILEVNLWLPENSNLSSMARKTIGPIGQVISWVSFLLLLFSLLSAYISGGSDLFHDLLLASAIDIPRWSATCLFTLILGAVVYFGIRVVDFVNRGLMAVKFGAYILLVILLIRFIDPTKLVAGSIYNINSAVALMVTITSFGYAAMVPSLRVYFHGDIKKLKKAIFIGSLIPLVCYIAWDMAIMGILPLEGDHGLISIMESKASTSDFVDTLSSTVANGTVTFFAKLFTSICVLTSFLGVGLCLTDFLADGFGMQKKGWQNLFIQVAALLPPLVIVLFFPNVFVKALEYAGIYCVILLILLPAWMAWRGRYTLNMAKGYRVFGGKALLVALMIFSLVMLVYGLAG